MRTSRIVAAVGAAVVVASIAVAVMGLRSSAHDNARVGQAPAASTLDLAALTANAPCPFDAGTKPATRSDLESFHAVAALSCNQSDRTFPGEGEWSVETRRATDDGIAALVSAFDQPNQSQPPSDAPSNLACSLVGYGPMLTLVDADGHSLVPSAPTDACGTPLQSVMQAVMRLQWQPVGTRRLNQVATPEALTAGCIMQVKDVPVMDAQSHIGASPGGPVFTEGPDGPLGVCIYRVGTDSMVGTFTRAVKLDPTGSTALRAALTGAGPTGSCADQPDFATVTARGGGTVYLELGGCWRLDRNDGGRDRLGSASEPKVVQELLGLR